MKYAELKKPHSNWFEEQIALYGEDHVRKLLPTESGPQLQSDHKGRHQWQQQQSGNQFCCG